MLKSILRILSILGLILICGCTVSGGCSIKSQISQKTADYIVMSEVIKQLNESQTNWTIIITARTNN